MNSKEFFTKPASEITPEKILENMKSDSEDVLEKKTLWLSNILNVENERASGLRAKANITLGLHTSLISILIGSTIIGLIPNRNEIFIMMLIFLSVIAFGIYYSLKVVAIPIMGHFINPTIALDRCSSKIEWYQKIIYEMFIVYKKNLDKTADIAYNTSMSFNLLVLAFIVAGFIELSNYILTLHI